jgi:hypothetical protein
MMSYFKQDRSDWTQSESSNQSKVANKQERVNEDSREMKDAGFKATHKDSLFSNFILFQSTMKAQPPLNL